MASAIVTRTISSTEDKRLSLGNTAAARTLAIGSNWSAIRIGLRLSMNDVAGATIVGAPIFAFGMCNGITEKYGQDTTAHFVGLKVTTASWVYAAGPPQKYGPLDWFPMKKIITTETVGASSVYSAGYLVGTPASNRTAWVLQITKGSPNYTIGGAFPATGQVATDIPNSSVFKSGVERDTLANVATSLGLTVGTDRSLAVDEADGLLDSFGVYWSRTGQLIEVSDVVLHKVA